MKILISIVLFICIPCSVMASGEDYVKWQGSYIYDHVIGRSAGGDVMVYGIEVIIGADGSCEIDEDGFQLMSRISCSVVRNDNGININFLKYTPENIVERAYKKGDRLLSMEYDRKQKKLITTWVKVGPDVKNKRGVYLKRLQKN